MVKEGQPVMNICPCWGLIGDISDTNSLILSPVFCHTAEDFVHGDTACATFLAQVLKQSVIVFVFQRMVNLGTLYTTIQPVRQR